MKNILYLIFFLVVLSADAQKVIKDKVYIGFKKNIDFKEEVNGKIIYYIKNEFYEKEFIRLV